jgi:hypothetical protein
MTVWRRLEEWQCAGVLDRLSLVLLDRLGEARRIDPGRVGVDSASDDFVLVDVTIIAGRSSRR